MQLKDTAFDCLDGTDVWIAAQKVPDDLVLDAIILRCEVEQGGPGLIKLGLESGVKG